jgi:hypothetical protein
MGLDNSDYTPHLGCMTIIQRSKDGNTTYVNTGMSKREKNAIKGYITRRHQT